MSIDYSFVLETVNANDDIVESKEFPTLSRLKKAFVPVNPDGTTNLMVIYRSSSEELAYAYLDKFGACPSHFSTINQQKAYPIPLHIFDTEKQ